MSGKIGMIWCTENCVGLQAECGERPMRYMLMDSQIKTTASTTHLEISINHDGTTDEKNYPGWRKPSKQRR